MILLKCIGAIIVVTLVCGCGQSGGQSVYLVYEGPERPLEEVAILLEQHVDVSVYSIDDQSSRKGKPPSDHEEYQLLPGHHSIVATYHASSEYGKPITIKHNFQRGHVYRCSRAKMMNRWMLDIYEWGTYKEVACELGKKYARWRTVLETLPPDFCDRCIKKLSERKEACDTKTLQKLKDILRLEKRLKLHEEIKQRQEIIERIPDSIKQIQESIKKVKDTEKRQYLTDVIIVLKSSEELVKQRLEECKEVITNKKDPIDWDLWWWWEPSGSKSMSEIEMIEWLITITKDPINWEAISKLYEGKMSRKAIEVLKKEYNE